MNIHSYTIATSTTEYRYNIIVPRRPDNNEKAITVHKQIFVYLRLSAVDYSDGLTLTVV